MCAVRGPRVVPATQVVLPAGGSGHCSDLLSWTKSVVCEVKRLSDDDLHPCADL